MNSVKCSHCGLTNWASEELCKRCGAPLINTELQVANKKSSGLPWKKLLFTLFVGAIVGISVLVWQKQGGRNRELAAAIQGSSLFAQPVTVEASKGTGFAGRLSPEALTLHEAGLLIVEDEATGAKSSVITTPSEPAPAQPSSAEPNPFALPPTVTYVNPLPNVGLTTRRLILKDVAATRDWQTFEDSKNQRSGWTVPVGTRELNEITSVEGGDTDTARVQFTWYWKPNEVGRHFDFNEQARQTNPHGRPTSNPVLSSEFPFKGTAELSKTVNGWEVKTIKWDLKMPDRIY